MLARQIPFLICLLAAAAAGSLAQNQQGVLNWRPTPTSPFDPVTMPATTLVTPGERARALELLDRARQNYDLKIPRGPSYSLSASFISNGQLTYEGSGRFEEVWAAPNLWKFTAQLGDFSMTRLEVRGSELGQQSADAIPARIQMARTFATDPVPAIGQGPMLRSADVIWRGMKLTCVLLSGDVPGGIPRHWVEMEWCVDPESGLLHTYSIAPGVYAIYDYSRPVNFEGHTLAGEVTVYKNSTKEMDIRVESIRAMGQLADADFQPAGDAQAMKHMGDFGRAMRGQQIVDGPRDPGIPIQPVIVHATFRSDGTVSEIEPITETNPELVERAVALVRSSHFGHMQPGAQQEMYIGVQFMLRNAQQ